jgi:UDP-glucose 4-epimerase
MKILVTGGAGFIGKHLTKFLVEKENIVTIFDNFSNSTKDSISYFIDMGVKVVEGDITNVKDLENVTRNQDVIIHLAAKISVEDSIKNPEKTFEINVEGTEYLLMAMSKNNIKNLIVASSAAIYTDLKNSQSFHDEQSIAHPISPYGKSKLKMEKNLETYALKNKINCIILRFFNIYGIGQTTEYAGVISKFVTQIKNEEPLIIFGDGLQTRDFVYIDDVIESIIQSIKKIKLNKFEIYNIGNGESISINSLADILLNLFGKKLEIIHKSLKKGDIRFSKSSIKKAELRLDYHPKISLIEGLKEFMDK